MLKILGYLTLSSLLIISIDGYKILMVCPMPAKSHNNLCSGVVDALVDQGHELTFINAFHVDKPKFRNLQVDGLMAYKEKALAPGFALVNESKFSMIKKIATLQTNMTRYTFEDAGVRKLLEDKNEKFDLVIFEYFMNEMFTGFGIKFKCPVVVLSPISPMTWLAIMTNTPLSMATVPNFITSFSAAMTLKERVLNTIAALIQEAMNWIYIKPSQKLLYEEYFPEESRLVPYSELQYYISGMLINSHPSIGVARPLLPNSIEIGGYHIKDPEPLPQDLKKILDSAKNGVVYFSMGSNLKSKDMSPEMKSLLMEGFKGLKQTVLWKYEEDLPNKPDNLIIRSWMPQTGILAHPNTKLFISHGGYLSCTEATHFGVPLLAIPIFGDQYTNAQALQRRGQGVMLDYQNITKESFDWSLKEILGNTKYAEKTKELHRLYHDRPMKPRDALVFHIEHIIRSKGGKHLSYPPLCRCSHLLLDVITVILVPVGIVFSLFAFLTCKCCRYLKRKPNKKQKKQ